MNDNRHARRLTSLALDGDAVGSEQPDAPGRRRRGAVRQRRSFHLALIMLLALSLIPLPIGADSVRAAGPPSAEPIAPPAKAVRLLEQLRDGNTAKPQPNQRLAAQAKPGKKAKPGKVQGKGRKHARVHRIKRKGCIFEVRKRTWTLVRKCTPKGTIVVPNGFTLNGRNRVMVVTGNAAKFQGAVIAAGFGRANVRNLRIEGNAGLAGQCTDLGAGVLFYNASGEIKNVTVRNLELPDPACTTVGIFGFGQEKVNILNSTVHNAGSPAIYLEHIANSTIAGNNILISSLVPMPLADGIVIYRTNNTVIRNNDFRVGGDDPALGIVANWNLGLGISGNRFHNLHIAINVGGSPGDGSSAVITDNQLIGVITIGILVEGGDSQILRNSVAGLVPIISDRGLLLTPGSNGLADDNAISGFACGIEDNSGIVIGGGNSYANNTINTC